MKKEKKTTVAARKAVEARWAKTTPEERSAYASKMAKMPRVEQRCFCGANSMLRAATRYFDCCRKAGVVTVDLSKRKKKIA